MIQIYTMANNYFLEIKVDTLVWITGEKKQMVMEGFILVCQTPKFAQEQLSKTTNH